MTPEPGSELLADARTLVDRHDSSLAGAWQRAAALLGRQALEEVVAHALSVGAPGAERASTRAQLLCLPTYAPTEPALQARFLWGALSRVCHHHPYELTPTAAEVDEWLRGVERIATELAPARQEA